MAYKKKRNTMAKNKAWCEDLINFIKIFKRIWENRKKITLVLTFLVIRGTQCFLSKTHKNHFILSSIALVLERKTKRGKIISLSRFSL